MSSPAMESVEALRAIVEPYIEIARNATAAECEAMSATYAQLADVAQVVGDPHAEALHRSVAALFLAHRLEALRASVIADHGYDPLEEL